MQCKWIVINILTIKNGQNDKDSRMDPSLIAQNIFFIHTPNIPNWYSKMYKNPFSRINSSDHLFIMKWMSQKKANKIYLYEGNDIFKLLM